MTYPVTGTTMRPTHRNRTTLVLALVLALSLALAAGFANDALGYGPEHVEPATIVPPSGEDPVDETRADPTAADPARTVSTEVVARPNDPDAPHARTNVPNTPEPLSNDTHEIAFTHAHATVTLTCVALEVTVSPADVAYDLVLTYVDTSTGRFYWMVAGPLNGTVVDPFGETDFRLVEMVVQAGGDPWVGVQTATVFGPEECETNVGGSTNDTD